ncbi:MAG: xylosidase, partial [Sediminibacterium sp.]|nr:xylosidase [Sediminibacterium sp.]
DLGSIVKVNAIQINYADQDATFLGKQTNLYHQYKIFASDDGVKWNLIIDKSSNKIDIPHEYVELEKPILTRFLRMENVHMASGKFAISGFRVFGKGNGYKPPPVKQFMVLRTEKDKRSAWIKWSPVDDAYGYNIYYGTSPDKLYNCITVHDINEYWFKGMDLKKTYYYTIEAISENGQSDKFKILKVE